MKREVVLDLLASVSENLRKTSLLHGQITCQLQELESRESLYKDKNIQELKQVLIDKAKLLNCWYRYKETLLFMLKKERIFSFLNRKKIGQLLKEYSWDSQDKIEETFRLCHESLFDLEKRIPDRYYPIVKLPDKEDFVEEGFRQLGQKNKKSNLVYSDEKILTVSANKI